MKRLKRIVATALTCMVASGAVAQDDTQAVTGDVANNSAFGDWIVTCEAITISQNACRLVQELSMRETNELVARFVAIPASDGVILLAQVPMGVYLPGGAVYRFAERDDLEQREMIWQRCFADVCEAAIGIDQDELALFAESESILFGFRGDANSDPIIVSVDVSEFAQAAEMIAPK